MVINNYNAHLTTRTHTRQISLHCHPSDKKPQRHFRSDFKLGLLTGDFRTGLQSTFSLPFVTGGLCCWRTGFLPEADRCSSFSLSLALFRVRSWISNLSFSWGKKFRSSSFSV